MAAAKTFTVPHQCDKADISPLAAKIGLFNSRPYRIGDSTHATGSLLFRGFAGARDKSTGKYVGVLRFELQQAGDELEAFDFNELNAAMQSPLFDGTAQGDDE